MKINKLFTNIKEIDITSPLFPQNLLALKDCPKKIYVLGDETILNHIAISIVGTRRSSEYGNSLAFDISKSLAKNDIVIVSRWSKWNWFICSFRQRLNEKDV